MARVRSGEPGRPREGGRRADGPAEGGTPGLRRQRASFRPGAGRGAGRAGAGGTLAPPPTHGRLLGTPGARGRGAGRGGRGSGVGAQAAGAFLRPRAPRRRPRRAAGLRGSPGPCRSASRAHGTAGRSVFRRGEPTASEGPEGRQRPRRRPSAWNRGPRVPCAPPDPPRRQMGVPGTPPTVVARETRACGASGKAVGARVPPRGSPPAATPRPLRPEPGPGRAGRCLPPCVSSNRCVLSKVPQELRLSCSHFELCSSEEVALQLDPWPATGDATAQAHLQLRAATGRRSHLGNGQVDVIWATLTHFLQGKCLTVHFPILGRHGRDPGARDF